MEEGRELIKISVAPIIPQYKFDEVGSEILSFQLVVLPRASMEKGVGWLRNRSVKVEILEVQPEILVSILMTRFWGAWRKTYKANLPAAYLFGGFEVKVERVN